MLTTNLVGQRHLQMQIESAWSDMMTNIEEVKREAGVRREKIAQVENLRPRRKLMRFRSILCFTAHSDPSDF